MDHPEENQGVVLTLLSPETNWEEWELDVTSDSGPSLEIQTTHSQNMLTSEAQHRVCTEARPSSECCLWPLTINLTEPQFNFILFPKAIQTTHSQNMLTS